MASPPPYTFSRPVPRDPAGEYVHDRLFTADRHDNALRINLGANNYVKTVTDEPSQWLNAIEQAGAQLLGHYPGAYAGYVRYALRPTMHGGGRDRWR